MPEGPELHLTSWFINRVCKGRIFGKIEKSEISKNPAVSPPGDRFTISATARGKEIKLIISPPVCYGDPKVKQVNKQESLTPMNILFTFGLAGKFEFYEAGELMKHAHLNFYTADQKQNMVLSFVDYMRFGKWTPNADFAFKERGPCVLTEYSLFRENVLQNLSSSVFNKPICEALLNQKYFNGIGNYLRAEILHRQKVPPFVSARSVLEPLAGKAEDGIKSEEPDLLQLCSILPQEVVQLEGSWYDGSDRIDSGNNFNNWLQCYYKDGMKNVADHNKRTIWFSGPLGPLAPEKLVVRGKKSKKKKDQSSTDEGEDEKKVKATKRTNKEQADTSKRKKTKADSEHETSLSEVSISPKRVTRSRVKKTMEAKADKKKAKKTLEVKAENDKVKVKAKRLKTEIKVKTEDAETRQESTEVVVNDDTVNSSGKTRKRRK